MRRMLAAVCVLGWFTAGATASAEVQLQIADGRVSLRATNATVREILTEWARVGQTTIVNLEKVSGGPVTLELDDVPEAVALDTVLRSVTGYLAAPRPTPVANLSYFDRIVVIPVNATTAAAAPARPQPTTAQRPTFPGFPGRPPFAGPGGAAVFTRPDQEEPDDGTPITNVVMPNRGAVYNGFQQPQVVESDDPSTQAPVTAPPQVQQQLPPGQLIGNPPTTAPGTATTPFGGTSVPGVVIQPPQQNPGATTPGR